MHVQVMDHPLIQHKVTLMRKKETGSKDFRNLLEEITMLMGYEITRDLPLEDVEIETPVAKMMGKQISGKKLGIVPVLRAGLGMVQGMLNLIPTAKVGHIGLYRDPQTLEPVEYYCKLPDVEDRDFIIVDPMLATGGSMVAAYEALLKTGKPHQVHIASVIGTPEGVEMMQKNVAEDTTLWCAAIDPGMNEHKYIVPGFGDCGDLCYGEKL